MKSKNGIVELYRFISAIIIMICRHPPKTCVNLQSDVK